MICDRSAKTATALALLIVFAMTTPAQSGENGTVVERKGYVFPEFEKTAGAKGVFSKEEYEAAAHGAFEAERIVYTSDGVNVSALVYRSRKSTGKLPVIVFNRGGYVRGDIAPELATIFNRLAREGFIVVAPMYRGSDGSRGKDEVGGADLADLMNITPIIRSMEQADAKNIFLYGESRGGMMVLQAIRDGFPTNAAATFGSFTDFDALVSANTKQYLPLLNSLWPDFESRKREIAERRSAIRWADRINVPLLLMHGGEDRTVDPLQTLKFAERLQELNKPYELIVFAGDNHSILRNQIDRDARAVAWFKKNLKK